MPKSTKNWSPPTKKSKPTIILCLVDSAITKTRVLVDGDRTVKKLWDLLQRIYTMSSTQAIENLQVNIGTLYFKDGEYWEKHVSTFL